VSEKRIDLVSPPFSGHLHPILAMGRVLACHYRVRVLSTGGAQAEISAAGLDGVTLLPGCDREMLAIVNPEHAVGSNPLRLHAQFRRTLVLLRGLRDHLREMYQAGPKPDLLLADFTLPVAGVVAAEFGIPWWTSCPSPCVMETPDGPPAYVGGGIPARNAAERARNAAGRALVRAFKRTTFGLFRRDITATGVKQLYRPDGSEVAYSPERVLALGLEELEFPRRWPESVRFTGPMLYTPPSAHSAPDFVEGKRHVLITLGTHLHWLKDRAAAVGEKLARRRPDLEIHFSDGRADGPVMRRGNFQRHSSISYAEHLAQYEVVVHHGGAGVMYHCLRHGIPSVVFPVDYDQFDHAARLEMAGCALRLRGLERLVAIVEKALLSEELGTNCRQMAATLRNFEPETRLLGLVHQLLA
jgi:UDP:flavonoid glycosyltransferase YjiC (YdhE family)